MFWMRSTGANGGGNEGAMLFDRRTGSGAVIVLHDDGSIFFQAAGGANSSTSGSAVNDDQWHHIAITFDQSVGGVVNIYLDGAQASSVGNSAAWSWPAGQEIELGRSHDGYWRSYDGLLDDVRIYSRILTDPEIASTHTSGALVDTSALKVRLNFDSRPVPGVGLAWKASGATLQSATAVAGSFTDLSPAVTSSPYYVLAQPSPRFFRYRRTPVAVQSNPFDM